ncbi:MAG: PEP/pyruvate-binding domain-containing protein, partial [Candidatus Levyibacteriota bacterium]
MVKKFVLWFKEVDKEDVGLVGGKGANLGEMTQAGFPVPEGFIVTAEAYYQFIKENNLMVKIRHIIGAMDYQDNKSLQKTSKQIKALIVKGKMSDALVKDIFAAYKTLSGVMKDALVAVRSSATAEDLPNASFAGQQETYLNVQGEANLLLKIKDAWASLFEARAIFYREEQKFDHFKVGIAIPVQRMVASDTSGVMFSLDPVTNDKTKIVIEAIYGLGELIVQGEVTPDHYEVSKTSLSILSKQPVAQKVMMVKKGKDNKVVAVPSKLQKLQKITNDQIVKLAEYSKKLEKHYYFPQDSEWAIEKGTIYLVQTRPVTTVKENKKATASQSQDTSSLKLLVKG